MNVPRPGRFALHKLIVAGRRGLGRAKAEKDRAQATALLNVLLADLPGEIELAWKSLPKTKGWRQPLRQSLARLDTDLIARLSKLGVR